jgi:hypothetical protein
MHILGERVRVIKILSLDWMNQKEFLKLKKPYKLSLLGKYIKKNKKNQENQNPTGLVFFI